MEGGNIKTKVDVNKFKNDKYKHFVKDEMTNTDIQMLGYQIFKDKLESIKIKFERLFHGKNRQKDGNNN